MNPATVDENFTQFFSCFLLEFPNLVLDFTLDLSQILSSYSPNTLILKEFLPPFILVKSFRFNDNLLLLNYNDLTCPLICAVKGFKYKTGYGPILFDEMNTDCYKGLRYFIKPRLNRHSH